VFVRRWNLREPGVRWVLIPPRPAAFVHPSPRLKLCKFTAIRTGSQSRPCAGAECWAASEVSPDGSPPGITQTIARLPPKDWSREQKAGAQFFRIAPSRWCLSGECPVAIDGINSKP